MGLKIFLPLLSLATLFLHGTESTIFTIKNKCPYPIWPTIASNAGQQSSTNSEFELASNASSNISIAATWSGRITANAFDRAGESYMCRLLDRGGISYTCTLSSTKDDLPRTLVEFTLSGFNGIDFYDISLVDGFNLPVSVDPPAGCTTVSCSVDINAYCLTELALRNPSGSVVRCKNACQAFKQPQYCCTGDYSSRDKCRPQSYSSFFKGQCPQAYTFPFDYEIVSAYKCPSGGDYRITYCP